MDLMLTSKLRSMESSPSPPEHVPSPITTSTLPLPLSKTSSPSSAILAPQHPPPIGPSGLPLCCRCSHPSLTSPALTLPLPPSHLRTLCPIQGHPQPLSQRNLTLDLSAIGRGGNTLVTCLHEVSALFFKEDFALEDVLVLAVGGREFGDAGEVDAIS